MIGLTDVARPEIPPFLGSLSPVPLSQEFLIYSSAIRNRPNSLKTKARHHV